MKLLITSGGTRVPIDPVRDIANRSRGVFGADLAAEALRRGCQVEYLAAEDAAAPFQLRVDLLAVRRPDEVRALVDSQLEFASRYGGRYAETRFRTYDDYAQSLRQLIESRQPDAVVLAAAVSDYVTDPRPDKVRSGQDLVLALRPAAKIISQVRTWRPGVVLVGFKLLVDASDAELLAAANTVLEDNGCDLVVANDLRTVESGRHAVWLVERGRAPEFVPVQPACAVIDRLLARAAR